MSDVKRARGRREQPWPIRLTHGLNMLLLVLMAGSGLQILVAYPRMGPRGHDYGIYPLQGSVPPTWLRLGGWLAGARALHFSFWYVFALNGVVYLAYGAVSGEWRRRAFLPARDAKNALATAAYYLRLRRTPPEQGLYNGLQRAAYTAVAALGVLATASGLAIYKPLQLSWLAWCLGGYDSARLLHLVVLVALALFTVGHAVMVFLHPRALRSVFTGGRLEP